MTTIPVIVQSPSKPGKPAEQVSWTSLSVPMRAAILSNSPWKEWNSRDDHAVTDSAIYPRSTEKSKPQRALSFDIITIEQSKENWVPAEKIKSVPDTPLSWQSVPLDDGSTKLSPMPNVLNCSPARNTSEYTRAVAGESVFKLVQVLKASALERGDTKAALRLGEIEAKVATPKRCQNNSTADKGCNEADPTPATPVTPQNLTARVCSPEKAPPSIKPTSLSIVCEGGSAADEGGTASHRSLASFCQHEEAAAAVPSPGTTLDTLHHLLLEHAADVQQHEAVQSLILQLDITLGFGALNSSLGADALPGAPPPTPLDHHHAAPAGEASPAEAGTADSDSPVLPASTADGSSLLAGSADESGLLLLLHSDSAALIGARARGSLEPTSVSDSSFRSADALIDCGPRGGRGGGARPASASPSSPLDGVVAAGDDTGLSVTAGSLGSWALAAALQSPRRSTGGGGGGSAASASSSAPLLLDSYRASESPQPAEDGDSDLRRSAADTGSGGGGGGGGGSEEAASLRSPLAGGEGLSTRMSRLLTPGADGGGGGGHVDEVAAWEDREAAAGVGVAAAAAQTSAVGEMEADEKGEGWREEEGLSAVGIRVPAWSAKCEGSVEEQTGAEAGAEGGMREKAAAAAEAGDALRLAALAASPVPVAGAGFAPAAGSPGGGWSVLNESGGGGGGGGGSASASEALTAAVALASPAAARVLRAEVAAVAALRLGLERDARQLRAALARLDAAAAAADAASGGGGGGRGGGGDDNSATEGGAGRMGRLERRMSEALAQIRVLSARLDAQAGGSCAGGPPSASAAAKRGKGAGGGAGEEEDGPPCGSCAVS